MSKYKLKSLSIQIGGKVFRKSDNKIFDTGKKFKGLKSEIEAAHKKGFFEKLPESQPKSKKAQKIRNND